MSANAPPRRGMFDTLEEALIAFLLAGMTVVTFANVIARYVFNTNILWALETTVFLFAWMVLLGASYCVKKVAHLGVDVMVAAFPPAVRKVFAIVAGLCCLAYALLMLKGGWDYWANFANLPGTTGRWFPTGFEDRFLSKSWYETNDIQLPAALNQFLSDWMNEGEQYEKMPRFIPYTVLPLAMALLTYRFVQALWLIAIGEQEMLIASHEAEDAVDEAAATIAQQEKAAEGGR
ncbi:MAG: TRAP transporter small permease [Pseudomonadota bacterium]